MSSSDNQVVRAAFEKAYPMPFACGWNSMTQEYECIWFEHAGEEPVEAAIAQHNDRYKVWQASREALQVQLPETPNRGVGYGLFDAGKEACREAIEVAGIRVAP